MSFALTQVPFLQQGIDFRQQALPCWHGSRFLPPASEFGKKFLVVRIGQQEMDLLHEPTETSSSQAWRSASEEALNRNWSPKKKMENEKQEIRE
jgi:hypothetical protein